MSAKDLRLSPSRQGRRTPGFDQETLRGKILHFIKAGKRLALAGIRQDTLWCREAFSRDNTGDPIHLKKSQHKSITVKIQWR